MLAYVLLLACFKAWPTHGPPEVKQLGDCYQLSHLNLLVFRFIMGMEPLLYYNTQKQANPRCCRCPAKADIHLTRDFINPFGCAVLNPNQQMHMCIPICIRMCMRTQTQAHATDARTAHSCTDAGTCMQACPFLIVFYIIWVITRLQMRHWCHPTASVSPSVYGPSLMQSKRFCTCAPPFSFLGGFGAQIIASTGSDCRRAAMQTVFAQL